MAFFSRFPPIHTHTSSRSENNINHNDTFPNPNSPSRPSILALNYFWNVQHLNQLWIHFWSVISIRSLIWLSFVAIFNLPLAQYSTIVSRNVSEIFDYLLECMGPDLAFFPFLLFCASFPYSTSSLARLSTWLPQIRSVMLWVSWQLDAGWQKCVSEKRNRARTEQMVHIKNTQYSMRSKLAKQKFLRHLLSLFVMTLSHSHLYLRLSWLFDCRTSGIDIAGQALATI